MFAKVRVADVVGEPAEVLPLSRPVASSFGLIFFGSSNRLLKNRTRFTVRFTFVHGEIQ
jgi:hypothetical protein